MHMYEKNLHLINVLVVQRQYVLGLGIHGSVLTKNQEALVCKCGHIAEIHLWELQQTLESVIAKPINLNAENFVNGYAIANCWSELDIEGRRCLCPILDLEFADD